MIADLSVVENLARVRERIAVAAARAGRDAADVRLVVVTKTHPVALIEEALAAGATDIGENRVQEALPKLQVLAGREVRFHLIGHLQSNKAKQAAQQFHLVHSVDSEKLARELDRHAAAAARRLEVLLQVNISGEDTKSGIEPADVAGLLQTIQSSCPALECRGFMTMAPLSDDAEAARVHFRNLRLLSEKFEPPAARWELSMGMTNDFEVAIEEGATLVRIGSAIFGSR